MLTCCAQEINSSNFEELFLSLICTFSHITFGQAIDYTLKIQYIFVNLYTNNNKLLHYKNSVKYPDFLLHIASQNTKQFIHMYITNHLYRPTNVGSMFQH